jgi:hypothetical protein
MPSISFSSCSAMLIHSWPGATDRRTIETECKIYPALVLNAATPSQRAILIPELLFHQSFSALVCCSGCTTSTPYLSILVFCPRRTRLLPLPSKRIRHRMSCGVNQENPNLSVELPNVSHFRTCPENLVLIENMGLLSHLHPVYQAAGSGPQF